MITVIQSPRRYAPVGQKLMFVVSSTNSANSGFRFVLGINGVQVYVQPNPSGVGMLDLEPIIREQVQHSKQSNVLGLDTEEIFECVITGQEGWLVNGVFTLQGSPTTLDTCYFFKASYLLSEGFAPSPSIRYGLNGDTQYLMSELTTETFAHVRPSWLNPNDVYHECYLSDWGLVYFPSATSRLTNTIENFYLELLNVYGVSMYADTYAVGSENNLEYLYGVYPQNLIANDWILTDVKYIRYTIIDSIGGSASRNYILGIIDDECKFDKIRLQWDNQVGGVDYWNFTKKSELTYNYERKQYTKVLGTYGDNEFTFNTSDRMLTDRRVTTTQGLVINTDWLTKAQYEFLNSLLRSDNVNIVNSDGSHTPVLIDANTLTIPDSRYSKLYQLTLNVKYSQPLSI